MSRPVTFVEKLAAAASRLHQNIADDLGPCSVACGTCGREFPATIGLYLAHGWPVCCGQTATMARIHTKGTEA